MFGVFPSGGRLALLQSFLALTMSLPVKACIVRLLGALVSGHIRFAVALTDHFLFEHASLS